MPGKKIAVPECVQERGPEAVALYKKIIAAGETERWAEMCAMQQAPGAKGTDRAFSQGARRAMDVMDDVNRQLVLARAKKAGINTQGKFYKGGLGKPDNPLAWVSTADDVIASCKAQKLNCTGVVNVKTFDEASVAPPPPAQPAADLVHQEMSRALVAAPGLQEKCRKSKKAFHELREQVVGGLTRRSAPCVSSPGTRKGRKA